MLCVNVISNVVILLKRGLPFQKERKETCQRIELFLGWQLSVLCPELSPLLCFKSMNIIYLFFRVQSAVGCI